RWVLGFWIFLSSLSIGREARAQPAAAKLHGNVLASDSKRPLAGVTIILGNTYVVTDQNGSYEVSDQPPGKYAVRILDAGYDDYVGTVELIGGQDAALDAILQKTQIGEEIVVSGSKLPEKRVEAPATLERVAGETVELTGGSNYQTALSQIKGIQYRQSSFGDVRVSMRGFDSEFNTRSVWMVDGKLAEHPGLGMPLGSMLPTPSLDIKSIEVLVGPAAALYGAEAVDGVINVITKTPWDESGVSAVMRSGNQDLTDATLRVAGTILHRFGYKVNAQWMQAHDFEPDRNLPFHYYGALATAPAIFEGDLVGNHYQVRQAKLEGYLYGRLAHHWHLKIGVGYSFNDGMMTTNTGRIELRGWSINNQTLQLSHPHWYFQVTRIGSDAGLSYPVDAFAKQVNQGGGLAAFTPDMLEALRRKLTYADASQLIDSDAQYHTELFDRLTLIGGVQFRAYLPYSHGTLFDDANARLYRFITSGYLQVDWRAIRDRLRIVGAVRLDENSDYGLSVSPKASAVLSLSHAHYVRVGYNRAFKTPTIIDAYLDIPYAGALGNRGFTIRDAAGNQTPIPALVPEENNALEIGYKGSFARRLFVDVVGFYSLYSNFISPLNLLANPKSTTSPVSAYLPDGTLTFANDPRAAVPPGFLITYLSFGSAQVVGANLGFDLWLVPDHLLFAGSVSYIHLQSYSVPKFAFLAKQLALPFNVPELNARAAVTLQDLGLRNSFVRLQGRIQEHYTFQSGTQWDSTRADFNLANGQLPTRVVVDLMIGYHFANGVTLTGTVFNLLNDHGIDVLGAPPGGILGFAQASYTYSGLDL
ncbi:MAG: TonB-dependent receptor, partial [Burkholderiales bacterium]